MFLEEGGLRWGFIGNKCNILCWAVCSEGHQDNSGFALSCQVLRGCVLSSLKIPSACHAYITSGHIPFNLTVHTYVHTHLAAFLEKFLILPGVTNQGRKIQMKKLIRSIISQITERLKSVGYYSFWKRWAPAVLVGLGLKSKPQVSLKFSGRSWI